ncbi:MAG: glycerophosphodiester phosphodiesterase [Jatrophihabitans sp.]|uniref:glycerophosphodiester phosphodiesterase n=1 Tax=Jatrophihabitans sp. TaxID=1932789 RepID=UPI00390EDAA7
MLLVAHRTPRSRAACEVLAAAGARVFEADIQVDDQHRIVVSHYLPMGDWLQRDNWRVRWHTSAAHDPTLDDVVALVPSGCRVSLDIKERTDEGRRRLIDALIAGFSDRSRFVVCGGREPDLERLRAAGFRTWRSAGRPAQLRELLAQGPLHDDAVSVRHSLLTPDVVARLHQQVATVVAWTVNDLRRARRVREFGVDGITTDRPAVLRMLASAGT